MYGTDQSVCRFDYQRGTQSRPRSAGSQLAYLGKGPVRHYHLGVTRGTCRFAPSRQLNRHEQRWFQKFGQEDKCKPCFIIEAARPF